MSQSEVDALNAILTLTEMEQEQNYTSMSEFFEDMYSLYSSLANREETPDLIIESSYAGIHLNRAYEENDFLKMIEEFRNGNLIHAKYALQIIQDAVKSFEKVPNIAECSYKNAKTNTLPFVVVGDLHGSFKDLYYLIQKFGIPGQKCRFVFNGDFVDRGDSQVEVLLTLLYSHLMYPSRVFLNRGNHEDLAINLSRHFDPNYKNDTDKKYGKYSSLIFNESQRLFRRLPVATIIENNSGYRVFITHGGLSNRLSLSYIRSAQFNRFQFKSVQVRNDFTGDMKRSAELYSDLLWSDPSKSSGCLPNSQRGAGYLFGPDVSEAFCLKHGFNLVIRSHELREEGVSQDHPYCLTVFSSSFYCGGSNKAAVVVINPNERTFSTHKFKASHPSKDSYEAQRRLLIAGFRSYLDRQSNNLIKLFRAHDSSQTGWIDLDSWAQILSDFISSKEAIEIDPIHFKTLKDHLCPCNDEKHLAQYTGMFDVIFEKQDSFKHLEFLKAIFSLFDTDKSKYLSPDEARKATELMNNKLGTNYSIDLLLSMDLNRDGVIDFQEFQQAFIKTYKL